MYYEKFYLFDEERLGSKLSLIQGKFDFYFYQFYFIVKIIFVLSNLLRLFK